MANNVWHQKIHDKALLKFLKAKKRQLEKEMFYPTGELKEKFNISKCKKLACIMIRKVIYWEAYTQKEIIEILIHISKIEYYLK